MAMPCPKKAFCTLYRQTVKGLSLTRQKGWSQAELLEFFPREQSRWQAFLLTHEETSPPTEDGRWENWEQLGQALSAWEDPREHALLRLRWERLADYLEETARPHADHHTLRFYLGNLSELTPLELPAGQAPRPGAPLSARAAGELLQARATALFPDHETHVRMDAHSLARASTGSNYLRLRDGTDYSPGEVDNLTAHELWVHLGSNLQGTLQTTHPWLALWAPDVTPLQEGLALIAEMVGGNWTEERRREVQLRHEAALAALAGDDAARVRERLRDGGLGEEASLRMVLRVFRGCSLRGGMAFGKELLYGLGYARWAQLASSVSAHDMRLALSGKMSFPEWQALRSGSWDIKLASPPQALLEWTANPHWKKTG
jgi:hypothetical protein